MGTPRRKDILDNIKTTLEGITTGNGYKTTIDTVERVVKEWDSVGPGSMPWLGYMARQDRLQYLPGSVIRCTLPVTVVGHVLGTSPSNASELLNNLIDDVIAALSSDQTRGGFAIATTVISHETDEGDPDALPDSRGGAGSLVVDVEVTYDRTTGSS